MTLKKGQINVSNLENLTPQNIIDVKKGLNILSRLIEYEVTDTTKQEAVDKLNALDPAVEILHPQSSIIKTVFNDAVNGQVILQIYKIITRPENSANDIDGGTYGLNELQINLDNLELIFSNEAGANDVINLPDTKIFPLGDLGTSGSSTILEVFKDEIDSLDPSIVVNNASSNITIFEGIVDGLNVDVLYTGSGDTYGLNDANIDIADIKIFEQEQPLPIQYWKVVSGLGFNYLVPINNGYTIPAGYISGLVVPEKQAPPTTGTITVPLDNYLGWDFTEVATDLTDFDVNTATAVFDGNARYLYNGASHPNVTGATWLKSFSSYQNTGEHISGGDYYLNFLKQGDGIFFWLVKKDV